MIDNAIATFPNHVFRTQPASGILKLPQSVPPPPTKMRNLRPKPKPTNTPTSKRRRRFAPTPHRSLTLLTRNPIAVDNHPVFCLPHLHLDLRRLRRRPEHVGSRNVHYRMDFLRRLGGSGDLIAGDGAAAVPTRYQTEGEEEEREDDEDADEDSDHDPETEPEDRSVLGKLRVHESAVED